MRTRLPGNGAAGVIAALLVCGVCACRSAPNEPAPAVNDASTAVPAALKLSADAWNNADLAGHVRPYADSATFMGSNGPIQGRDRVGESLARSFWRDGKPRQQLSFDRITVRPLGDAHALTTGHFLLSGGGEADRSGWFSLTWEKSAAGWQIVHDHSS
jgi:ketosteroid isomerase-like protein